MQLKHLRQCVHNILKEYTDLEDISGISEIIRWKKNYDQKILDFTDGEIEETYIDALDQVFNYSDSTNATIEQFDSVVMSASYNANNNIAKTFTSLIYKIVIKSDKDLLDFWTGLRVDLLRDQSWEAGQLVKDVHDHYHSGLEDILKKIKKFHIGLLTKIESQNPDISLAKDLWNNPTHRIQAIELLRWE